MKVQAKCEEVSFAIWSTCKSSRPGRSTHPLWTPPPKQSALHHQSRARRGDHLAAAPACNKVISYGLSIGTSLCLHCQAILCEWKRRHQVRKLFGKPQLPVSTRHNPFSAGFKATSFFSFDVCVQPQACKRGGDWPAVHLPFTVSSARSSPAQE